MNQRKTQTDLTTESVQDPKLLLKQEQTFLKLFKFPETENFKTDSAVTDKRRKVLLDNFGGSTVKEKLVRRPTSQIISFALVDIVDSSYLIFNSCVS